MFTPSHDPWQYCTFLYHPTLALIKYPIIQFTRNICATRFLQWTMDSLRWFQEPSCQHRYSSMFYLLTHPLLTCGGHFCSHKHKVLFFASLQICASGYAAFLDNLMCSRSRWDANLTDGSGISRPTRCLCLLFLFYVSFVCVLCELFEVFIFCYWF